MSKRHILELSMASSRFTAFNYFIATDRFTLELLSFSSYNIDAAASGTLLTARVMESAKGIIACRESYVDFSAVSLMTV